MDEPSAGRPGESLSERLARLFGPRTDPGISLSPPSPASSTGAAVDTLLRAGGVAERYEVRGEIDRGGMGVVLDVYDRELRRSLAMKVALSADGEAGAATLDGRRLVRFLEEAQITSQLDHPGVVPVHELGVDAEGRVYFTMRRVRGRDLREVFHCVHFGLEGWTVARALGVLLRVCETLAFAHARGVLHRDLKPANVMAGAYGEVYVVDWGLARVIGRATPDESEQAEVDTLLRDERGRAGSSALVTGHGDVLGTPAYMPPEQARGDLHELSARADVYAVGALLYHLLAGEPPYCPEGRATTQVAALTALRAGPPRRLSDVREDIDSELASITEKAMAYEPAQRYADMQALADDLRAWLEQRVVAAHESGPWAEVRKWTRRNRAFALAVVAGLVALLGGLATTSWQFLRAERRAADAAASAQQARVAAAKVLRLSDLQRLAELQAEAERLWPALPERVDALRDWLARADGLAAGLDAHRSNRDALRRGVPQEEHSDPVRSARLETALAEREALAAGLAHLAGGARDRLEQRLAEADAALETLEREARPVPRLRFPDVELAWQHDLLEGLIDGIERLTDPDPAVGLRAQVAARLQLAERIEEHSTSGAQAAAAWAHALAGVRSDARYDGVELAPVVGLLPLGPDPESGLQEFAHLLSGAAPRRAADGMLALDEDCGVVLVLIPPGSFRMGAQALAASAPGYDPAANDDELPPHEVHLEAFFLGKHELTQAQWLRAMGANPSVYGPHNYAPSWNRDGAPASLLHPVERITWDDCARALPRLDLWMPTEAQWEYAARAGSESVWWTGDSVAGIQYAGNLADAWGARNGGAWPVTERELDDGHVCHAPVGSFAPNPFGLHDTIGNVFEWCGDGFGSYATEPRAGDGARPSEFPNGHPRRGGAWSLAADDARSAARNPGVADFHSDALGVRPARGLR